MKAKDKSRIRRNTKRRNTKRRNTKRRNTKRRTYSLRRVKRKRSNKNLYGGSASAAPAPAAVVLAKFTEMIDGNDFLKKVLPAHITLDNIRTSYPSISDRIEIRNIISEGASNLDKSIASAELFSFWHEYGCVLSDETLYKLFKALYFHSIFEGFIREAKGDQRPDGGFENARRDGIYEDILGRYPGIKQLGILYLKLKHFIQDREMDRDAYSLAAVFSLTADFLKILVNLAIASSGYFAPPVTKSIIRGPKAVSHLPALCKIFESSIIPALKTYIESEPFDKVKRRDYDLFNGILMPGKNPEWHSANRGSITLDSLKRDVHESDPISRLEMRDDRSYEPYGPYGYPAAAAAAEAEPAAAAAAAAEPAPAAAAAAVAVAVAEDEVVVRAGGPLEGPGRGAPADASDPVNTLMGLGFERDDAIRALDENKDNVTMAANALLSTDWRAEPAPEPPAPAAEVEPQTDMEYFTGFGFDASLVTGILKEKERDDALEFLVTVSNARPDIKSALIELMIAKPEFNIEESFNNLTSMMVEMGYNKAKSLDALSKTENDLRSAALWFN
jgi:hypothetical protein